MELARSVNAFLDAMLPASPGAEGSRVPFRLVIFDEQGRVLHRAGRDGDEPMRGGEDLPDQARRPPADGGEAAGRTAAGRPWVSLRSPLPGKQAGVVVFVGPDRGDGPSHRLALSLLARSLKQHFAIRNTLEETRLKAQFDERIIRSISSGFVVLLPDTRILYINPAGARILGGNVDDLLGRRLDTILTSELRILSVIKTGQPILDQEMIIQTADRSIHIVKTAVAVFDDDGRVIAVMDLFKEIREVRRMVNHMAGSRVHYTFGDILHRSAVMAETVEMGRTAAKSSLSVLITGESGTGKELFAQAIHAASARREAPFVVIDCASMPRDLVEGELFGYMEGAFTGALKGGRPGKFELADGGTVFLDELGELPLELQSRFLRVLQSRQVTRLGGRQPVPVDIRVIAATNRNLLEQIRTKSFRDDLYYRLNVLSLSIPPLRSRPEDILLLAEHFLEKYQIKMRRRGLAFTEEAVRELLRNPWPGNVRELENAVARAVQICQSAIRPDDLRADRYAPAPLPDAPPQGTVSAAGPPFPDPAPPPEQAADGLAALRALEARFYLSTLKRHGGNIAATARFLGVARSTVYKKMRGLGLDPDAGRG